MNQLLDVLTAVGTAGSFVTAVVIFGTSTRSARLDRRQAQAVLVDAWIKTVVKDTDSHRVVYEVSNHSDQSIRQLKIVISTNSAQVGWPYVTPVVPPTVRGEFARYLSLPIPTTATMNELEPDLIRGFYRLNIDFVDTAGRHWNRDFQGRLSQVHDRN